MELVELMKTAEYEEPLDPCLKCSKANITSHLRSAIRVALGCEAVLDRILPAPFTDEPKRSRKPGTEWRSGSEHR